MVDTQYLNSPKKPLLISVGIIRKADKVLIAQRKDESFFEANKWEFPGGKVEFLEHPEESLIREIQEEVNLEVSIDKLLTVVSHVYERTYEGKEVVQHCILLFFLADYISGDVEAIDCQDAKWVNYDELEKHEFVAADGRVLKNLLESR